MIIRTRVFLGATMDKLKAISELNQLKNHFLDENEEAQERVATALENDVLDLVENMSNSDQPITNLERTIAPYGRVILNFNYNANRKVRLIFDVGMNRIDCTELKDNLKESILLNTIKNKDELFEKTLVLIKSVTNPA